MLLTPIRLDVLFPRIPWMNYVIISITTIFTFAWWFLIPQKYLDIFLLRSWSEPMGWFLSALVHGGFGHWFFNIVFLWVFGNAICSKVGNFRYFLLYLFFTISAGICHLLMSNTPAIGASGAINGVIGFYLALYPINQIKMFYLFGLRPGTFQLDGYWVIGFWLICDIMGAVLGWGRVAYGAHLGGFFGGLALAFIFLKFKLVEFQRADNKHLFHKIFGSFVVDEVNRSMLNYLQSLGKKEVRVKIGDLNEQSVPADLLRRMIQAKQVKGVDQIYCQREGEWDLISRYLNKKVIEAKSEGIDFNDFPDDINHSSSDQEIISSLKANILSWNEEKFYLHRGEQTFGPYSARLLAEYLEQNRVAKDDLIFDKKNQQWQPLKEVFSKAKIN